MKRSRKYFSVIIAIILALSCIVLPSSAADEPHKDNEGAVGKLVDVDSNVTVYISGEVYAIGEIPKENISTCNTEEKEYTTEDTLESLWDVDSSVTIYISGPTYIENDVAYSVLSACSHPTASIEYTPADISYVSLGSSTHHKLASGWGTCNTCGHYDIYTIVLSTSAHSGGVPSSSSVPYPADATYCAGSVTTTKYSACGQCGFQKPTETKYPPTHTLTTNTVSYSATVTDCPYTVTTKSHSCGYSSSTVSPANHTHSFTTYPGYKKCNKRGEIVPTVAGMSILDELGIDYTDLTPEEIVEILHAGYTYFTEDNLLIE